MAKLNPFRVSFDGPPGSRKRTRARVTATVVSGAAIFLGATSLVALLNIGSEAIGNGSKSRPQSGVRILATDAEDPSGKTCEEQTWPYLEARCLKSADPRGTERSTPKHGLGSQRIALTPGPADNPVQSSLPPLPEPGTTGSATSDASEPKAANGHAPARVMSVPIPVPAPERVDLVARAEAESSRSGRQNDATQQGEIANPRLSKREQRRLEREARKRLQRERREDARRLREERKQARREAIVRRWTEHSDESPSGGNRRVIVIGRGSPDDAFFQSPR